MEYSPLPYLRRLGRAQRSLMHHFRAARDDAKYKMSIEVENKELAGSQKTVLAENRKYKDIVGALVSSQNDVEQGSKGETPQVGLSDSEILGNIWIFIL